MVYIRTKENQGKHDSAVAYWAQDLIKKGWSNVRSDLPGNIKPPTIGNYIPDVYGSHGQQEIIIEVETEDSKNSEHARLQLAAFQYWANQSPNNRKFLLMMA